MNLPCGKNPWMLPTPIMCKARDFPDEEKNKYLHSSRLIIVSNLELYNINPKLNNADRNRIPVVAQGLHISILWQYRLKCCTHFTSAKPQGKILQFSETIKFMRTSLAWCFVVFQLPKTNYTDLQMVQDFWKKWDLQVKCETTRRQSGTT